ncbi:MAG TPA: alpha-ketoglutarate-dependent dioxygenase AlkB [Luteimonas sp.]|nr:alpha-ketoglutarate-dependent dioxygenase AlkB [Luteimonas sp.]
MTDHSLFPASALQLTQDAEGGIRYWPDAADAETAARWFAELRERVPWKSERRPMYDRVVDVPRLLAAFRLDAIPGDLPALEEIAAVMRARIEAPFNAVGLNLYRNGNDSVAMHNDKLHTLTPGQPIAIVSLGAPRRMDIRAKAAPRRTQRIVLEPGSLLAMSHASQLCYEHGIPKTSQAIGPRISVVCRVRPAGRLSV